MKTYVPAMGTLNEARAHTLSIEETTRRHDTSVDTGLSREEAQRRLKRHGFNELPREGRRNVLRILADQVLSPMILLLIAVVGVSLFIGHFTDAAIIGVIVILNTLLGFVEEFRAEKTMESIRLIAAPEAKVRREGRLVKIPAREVVPGDLVELEAGDRVPADLRLAGAATLQIDESLLTGESTPVFKETTPLSQADLPLGDQSNLAFTGSLVVGGRGSGIVIGTGRNTELGRIAQLMTRGEKGETPLKKRLHRLTRQLSLAAFGLCGVIFGIGLLQGEPLTEMLLTAMSLGISAIPEGLPAVITISLSLGSLRLARRGALVRHLPAVEGLGSVTVICADKTGTLTQNRMTVRYPDGEVDPSFLRALILCNDAELGDGKKETGDPMEIALLRFAAKRKADPSEIRKEWKRIHEIPFDTERKRMATIHEHEGRRTLFAKGAPEKIMSICAGVADGDQLSALQEKLASQGLRLLAVAMKELPPSSDLGNAGALEKDLTFLGFVGLQDPPRNEVKAAIAECLSAGIRPMMITGDYKTTAVAIAKELGIPETSVFARISPEDKLTIVRDMQRQGEFVAMTGDGVNDAPALKTADVGIAMGRGTDVAKEASSLILVEEDFSTIVGAVREGRIIYDNIRKFVRYMLTTNFGEIATVLAATLVGLPALLLPVQILWINLVTDGLPAVALGYEPAEGNVMARPPRSTGENILGRGLWAHILWVGILMGCLTVGTVFLLTNPDDRPRQAGTIAFTTLTIAQMGHVLGIRSETSPLWRIGLMSNWRLTIAIAITVLAQLALVYLPPLQKIFHMVPLSSPLLLACCVPAVVIYLAVEIEKTVRKKSL